MECPVYQVLLGYHAVMDGMAVSSRRVTKESQEILDPRDLLALLVQSEGNRCSGPKGEPVLNGMLANRNWRESAWKNLDDNRDNGLIKVRSIIVSVFKSLLVLALIIHETLYPKLK